jgi:hypothetical protein
MIGKWLSHNWLGLITATGILYGIIMSTYNFIENRKTKKRRLDVKIAYGEFRDAPIGTSSHPMLFIDVANIGYCPVTINAPYFELPDGRTYVPPEPLTIIRFPFELNAGKSCSVAVRAAELMNFFGKSCGYAGEVQLYGVVQDATEDVWKSKRPWRLGLRDGKQGKREMNLERKATEQSEGNRREYGKYASVVRISRL